MVNEAIILAGGLGTRLKTITKDLPKSMVDINGKPFLCYLLSYLKSQGIKKVVLAVSYKREAIQNFFKNEFDSIKLFYSIEEEPLGTGGAIKKALEFIEDESTFVLNGDTFFNINLSTLFEFQSLKKGKLTIALKLLENFDRYGTVEIDNNNKILKFNEKKFTEKGLINGGIYLIEKSWFLSINLPIKFSFEKDFLEISLKNFNFYGLPFNSYFVDIGVPEDYKKACTELF